MPSKPTTWSELACRFSSDQDAGMQNFSTPMKVRCSAGRGFEVSGDGPDNLVERSAGGWAF
jgi:hypothetical protein